MKKRRHRLILFIGIITLSCAAGDRAPWTESTHFSPHSTPGLPWNVNRKILENGKNLYLCGGTGVQEYFLEKERYRTGRFWRFENLLDAVIANGKICVLEHGGLVTIDLKSGKTESSGLLKNYHNSYNMPQLAAVPGEDGILAAVPGALYFYNMQTRQATSLNLKMRPQDGALAAHPAAGVFVVNSGRLYRYEAGGLAEIGLSEPLYEKECYHFDVSPDGRYLIFGNPLSAYDIAGNTIVGKLENVKLIRWGTAVDIQRNLLYAAGWRDIQVFYPADNPREWREIDRLGGTDNPPVYTHRDVAPASSLGSLHYLKQTDELLFAGRVGITVFGNSPECSLVEKNDYSKFIPDNSAISGNTAMHRFLRKNQMVGIWASTSHPLIPEQMANFRKTGINTLIHLVFQVEHGQFYPPHDVRETVLKTGKLCREHGLQYTLALTPFNISINNTRKEFRQMILPSGEGARYNRPPRNELYTELRFPCYLDRGYSEKAGIEYNMEEFAKIAGEAGVSGIIFELGDGFTPTNIRSSLCCCDDCFSRFCAEMKLVPPPGLAAAGRFRYLVRQKKYAAYEQWMTRELAAICRRGMGKMQRIVPDMAAMVMLPETASDYTGNWLYNAFIEGFWKAGEPVIVFSEQTYAVPYMPQLCQDLTVKWARMGYETILIPGLVNYWIPPEYLRERSRTYLQYNPGIYYYEGYRWYNSRLDEPFYRPRSPFIKGNYTLGDYINTLSR